MFFVHLTIGCRKMVNLRIGEYGWDKDLGSYIVDIRTDKPEVILIGIIITGSGQLQIAG